MLFPNFLVAGAAVLASVPGPLVLATILYVASYDGNVTTLNLTIPARSSSAQAATRVANASLQTITRTTACSPSPAWLTLDSSKSVLYCLGEGSPNGTLASFRTSPEGVLTLLDNITTIGGPVSSVLYGEGDKGLATAEYSGSSFSAFDVSNPAALSLKKAETFTLSEPGPNAARQDAPHPHHSITDPTGQFVLVPDLGADLVRVYLVNKTSLDLTPVAPLSAASGSGPRHAAFLQTGNRTLLYVVAELGNTITGYEVTYYANNTLGFQQFYVSSTHGLNGTVSSGAAAAEIHITPDSKFLIVSSRMENAFTIPNFDPTNSTQIASDTLINFSIDAETGGLTAIQTFPAGGRIPRQFSVNKAGDLLGVGLQSDGRVVIIGRDVETGLLKDFVAHAAVSGGVSYVMFDE